MIEAIIENVEIKKQAYAQLEAVVGPHCLIASNTSSLCITELGAGDEAARQGRRAALLQSGAADEAGRSDSRADDAPGDARCAVRVREGDRQGADPAPDRGGFIVNRLLVPYLLDAIRCHEEGLGTVEDIDNGMKLGCGYPMGPFTLLDFVGLDTTYYIANIMFDEFRETRFAPPPLLKRMVLAGHLGKKSGKGFYDYTAK